MSFLRFAFALASFLVGPTVEVWAQARPVSGQLTIGHIEDSVVVLTDGRRWEPGLYGITHVYTLQVAGGAPFFVLRGVGCQECDGEYGLYVLRPGERIKWLHPPLGFAYPGRHLEMLEDSADAYRRQFFGHCLPSDSSTAVQFAHEQTQDNSWVDSIRTLVPARDSLIARNYVRTDSLARLVLQLARLKQCHELAP